MRGTIQEAKDRRMESISYSGRLPLDLLSPLLTSVLLGYPLSPVVSPPSSSPPTTTLHSSPATGRGLGRSAEPDAIDFSELWYSIGRGRAPVEIDVGCEALAEVQFAK